MSKEYKCFCGSGFDTIEGLGSHQSICGRPTLRCSQNKCELSWNSLGMIICLRCLHVWHGPTIANPSHTLKEYKAAELLQLRLERHVAKAAANWFELEKCIENAYKENSVRKDSEKYLWETLFEVFGQKAVLLLKKE